MRYLIQIDFGSINPFISIDQIAEAIAGVINVIAKILNPLLIKLGYKLLKVNVTKDSVVHLNIYVQKLKTPQILPIILEIIEALTPLLTRFIGLGLIILGWRFIELKTQEVKEQQKREELVREIINKVKQKKLSPKVLDLVEPIKVTIPKKPKYDLVSAITNLLSIASIFITVYLVYKLLRMVRV